MEKVLSIITNFGCHYKCPYCIVKTNSLYVPETTVPGLYKLEKEVRRHGCNALSISGGGDPLFEYERHTDWYAKLFQIAMSMKLPVDMHTSYMTDESDFPFTRCRRVAYHVNSFDQLSHIHRTGREIVRVVVVVASNVTEEDIDEIARFVENSSEVDELSFRQFVDDHYRACHYHEDYLRQGHGRRWFYIEQNDYNLYYAENRVLHRFADFKDSRLFEDRCFNIGCGWYDYDLGCTCPSGEEWYQCPLQPEPDWDKIMKEEKHHDP